MVQSCEALHILAIQMRRTTVLSTLQCEGQASLDTVTQ